MRRLLVIDTQLAVLLIVGNAKRAYVGHHKRLSAYVPEDYDLLLRVIDRFRGVVCSVNVLTETSNLIRQVSEPRRSEIAASLKRFIGGCDEVYRPSVQVMKEPTFFRLGLTDASLLNILNGDRVLLTADLPLYVDAVRSNHHTLNFAHLRENEMLSGRAN